MIPPAVGLILELGDFPWVDICAVVGGFPPDAALPASEAQLLYTVA